MDAKLTCKDFVLGVPMIMRALAGLDVSMVTTSYRPDMPGLAIELVHEADCKEAARRLLADRHECDCPEHTATYRRRMADWPVGEGAAELVLSWQIDDMGLSEVAAMLGLVVPDDASELDE